MGDFEHSFNIDDWMRELLPEETESSSDNHNQNRVERGAVSVPSSSRNNSVQQNMPAVNMDESYQFAATTQQNMIMSSMSVKPEGPSNPVGACYPNSSLAGFRGFSQNQTSQQFNQQQMQMHHQGSPRAAAPSPARLSNHREQQDPLKNHGTTAPPMRQQQRALVSQPHSLTMRSQQPVNAVQQPDQTSLEMRRLHHISQQVKLQHPLQMQNSLLQSNVQTHALQQPRSFPSVDQNKPESQNQHFFQGPLQASASAQSVIQVQTGNSSDWIDQAHSQFQQFRAAHINDVAVAYKRATEMKNLSPDSEPAKKVQAMMQRAIQILNMTRGDMLSIGKDKFYHYMNYVKQALDRIRRKPSVDMQPPLQIDASQRQLRTATQLHQRGNVPQSYGTSTTLPGPLLEQMVSHSGKGPRSSFQVGSSAGVQKADTSSMMTSQRYSLMRSMHQQPPNRVSHGSHASSRKNSQLGFEEVSPMLPQSIAAGDPQTTNLSAPQQRVVTSRNILSPVESSIGRNNSMKSVQQSPGDQHMPQQLMQKLNCSSPRRHFVGLNKNSSQHNSVSSPQNSQQSSSLFEYSKSRTASPMAFPSPLNPQTPSAKPADSEKSSLSLEDAFGIPIGTTPSPAPPEPGAQSKNQDELATGAQELPSSPLATHSAHPDQDESTCDPIKRLLNVVKSMSSKALDASIRDITAVTNLTDRMTENFYFGTHRMDIFHDLPDDTKNCRGWDFPLIEAGTESRRKRQFDNIGSSTEMESHGSNMVKRQTREHSDELLQEIKDVNDRLIEVVVDASRGTNEGPYTVTCSYCPIELNRNRSFDNTSPIQKIPYLVLQMIVPADYPRLSPAVVETAPSCCCESEEGREMWNKAMSKFNSAIRKTSPPLSIKEMAKTWDGCAREVYREFALQKGGGDFSSLYGNWESCVSATAT